MNHKFWGEIQEDWAGISGNKLFKISYFKDDEIQVFLGEEFDEDGEEIEELPTNEELDGFEKTYSSFLENIDDIILQIKEEAFLRYKKIYAKYYEDSKQSGEEPLNIDTKEKHFEYIKELLYVRILKGNEIKMPIRYDLDTEHGIEIKLKDNKIVAVGGIAET
ncbi:DUF6985 domain-containing protein [Flavobacterium sp. KACC 22763]|uniref:DUF6985 domain-containing protein n=1 Tax=Flavobacterium sp. KACC 22763 TaxID=3025668 RepID=UPI00236500BD|nr:hypothetical protein [Flavobacterium sp. KACC 22763]WDF64402.1 hypothetical protein PQ463_22645 [Flavobacterium sp. KACC 22763]